jgi:hypothetical protein
MGLSAGMHAHPDLPFDESVGGIICQKRRRINAETFPSGVSAIMILILAGYPEMRFEGVYFSRSERGAVHFSITGMGTVLRYR